MESSQHHDLGPLELLASKQDKVCRLLSSLINEMQALQRRVGDLEPRTYLQAIESPPNPNNFVNVARYLREVITRRNQSIPEGGKKYFEFPSDLTDNQLNSDAMLCIEALLCLRMIEYYGKKTWAEVYEEEKVRCERFIDEAKHVPELCVFSQAAAQWAIRKLVENKMKSKLRSEKMKAARDVARLVRQGTGGRTNSVRNEPGVSAATVANRETNITLQRHAVVSNIEPQPASTSHERGDETQGTSGIVPSQTQIVDCNASVVPTSGFSVRTSNIGFMPEVREESAAPGVDNRNNQGGVTSAAETTYENGQVPNISSTSVGAQTGRTPGTPRGRGGRARGRGGRIKKVRGAGNSRRSARNVRGRSR